MSLRWLARWAIAGLVAVAAACGGPRTGPWPAHEPEALPSNPPRNGLEVIGWMRRAHPSRTLRTLAFSVTITEFAAASAAADSPRVTRARAVAALPGKMRVAELPASRKTAIVRDRQRLAVFERGKRIERINRVDLMQLLAFDVFAQSTDTTIMWLDSTRMRFGLAELTELNGRRAWLVGADDDRSARFWIDAERWRVIRIVQRDPRARDEMMDIRFVEFRDVDDVPVPVRIEIYRNGRLEQRTEISEVEANPKVPVRAFDTERWRDVRI